LLHIFSLLFYTIIPLSPYYSVLTIQKWYFWMVLHSVTLWTGAWESGSGWGLGVPKLSLCVTGPKTYLLWFWLPPSFPIRSITLLFSLPFLSVTLSLWSHVFLTRDFTVAFGHGHPLVHVQLL
jgi:hypothetical protein